MVNLPMLAHVEAVSQTGPNGRQFHGLLGDTGNPDEVQLWASLASWARVFEWPPELLGRFDALVIAQESVNPGRVALHEGVKVYQQHVIDDAVVAFYYAWRSNGPGTYTKQGVSSTAIAQLRRTVENISAYRQFAKDVAAKAVRDQYRKRIGGGQPTEVTFVAVLSQKIAEALETRLLPTEGKVRELDTVVGQLQREICKDPDEHVLACVFCNEKSVSPNAYPIPGNRANWETLLGMECSRLGFMSGPKQTMRLSGSPVDIKAKTWRRRDLEVAFGYVIGKARGALN